MRCRQSVASIGHMAFLAFYVWYFLLLGTFSFRLLMSEEKSLDPKYWDCSGWAPIIVDLTVVFLFLCMLPRLAIDRLYKKPTFRVSPESWSLEFWPNQVTQNFFLKRFLWMHEKGMSGSSTIHGAKVRSSSRTPGGIVLSAIQKIVLTRFPGWCCCAIRVSVDVLCAIHDCASGISLVVSYSGVKTVLTNLQYF